MNTPLLIRSSVLTGFEALARSAGLQPIQLLRDAGIDPACLNEPDSKLSADAFGRLLEHVAQKANIDNLGLQLAKTRGLSVLGPIGLLAREQPSVRLAIESIIRYLYLQNEAIALSVKDHGNLLLIQITKLSSARMQTRQGAELVVGGLVQVLRSFLGEHWKPQQTHFTHSAPRDLTLHRYYFGEGLQFNSDLNGISCRSRDLETPVPMSDPDLARYAQKYLDDMGLHRNASMSDKVKQLVHALLPTGRCTIERVSGNLGVNRRTIHRQLAAGGETFSAITNTVRCELAARYLASSDRSLSDIAELLGFSALSGFSHWFHDQFGCSPSAWRQQGADGVPLTY